MKEITLRTWHRKMGILFALFIFIQAISGLALSLEPLLGPSGTEEGFWEQLFEFVHRGAGPIGAVYRIVLGLGVLWMAVTGLMIYIRIRRRTKAS